jgi:predicted NBD/HSP70 family sugar kinase
VRQRKTYLRAIDAVFGKGDAYNELPELIETGSVERRGDLLAFGVACGDVLGLSIERETVSWAVLGPRGPIASNAIDAPVSPIQSEPASREELEGILVEVLQEARSALAHRSLAGVGVAWPAAIAPDGEPYEDWFGGSGFGSVEALSPRNLVADALNSAGIEVQKGADGEPVIEMINDADADLLYDARLGVGRGVGDLLGLKICGGIGISLIHRGRLVRGHAGRAGEIEHIKVRFEDFALPDQWKSVRELDELEPCSCNGSNCIARFATGKTIIDQLSDYDEPPASYNERGRRVEGDARKDVVTAVFSRAGKLLGQALLGPVLAFDPERIIVSSFPKHANLLQGLRTALTDGTRVHLDPEDIVFASAKRERTAAGAGWLVVEQEVIPRIEEAVAGSSQPLRRFELPYWLRSQVPADEHLVGGFGPRYSPQREQKLIAK